MKASSRQLFRKREDWKKKKCIDRGRILVGNTPVLALADGVHYNLYRENK